MLVRTPVARTTPGNRRASGSPVLGVLSLWRSRCHRAGHLHPSATHLLLERARYRPLTAPGRSGHWRLDLDQDSRKLSATYAQMQNRTAAIVSHARLCRATSDPLAHWLRPSALHNRMAEGQAMNQQRTHWWPSIDTLVIILSLTVICFGVWLMAG